MLLEVILTKGHEFESHPPSFQVGYLSPKHILVVTFQQFIIQYVGLCNIFLCFLHFLLAYASLKSYAMHLQVKGKAAIDVVCNPLGKSGGALIQQFMILTFGSLANSTPYLGGILLVIVTAWLAAARSLDKQFTELRKEEELEKELERAAVKIPIVSDNSNENGSLTTGSDLNPAGDLPSGSSERLKSQ